MRSVKNFVRTYLIARVSYTALETGIWVFILLSLLYVVIGLFRIPWASKITFIWPSVLFTGVIFAVRTIKYTTRQAVIQELSARNITPYPDDIQNAYELETSSQVFGHSPELAQLHVNRIKTLLKDISPLSLARPKAFSKLISACLLWFAFYVTASVSGLNTHFNERGFFPPNKSGARMTTSDILPQLTGFLVTYNYPSYTGKTKQIQPGPAIETLAGAQVTIQAECNLALSSALLKTNELDIPATVTAKGKLLQATFSVKGEEQYWFELKPARRDSDTFTSARYPIFVSHDNAPVLRLISPLDNLAVSPDAVIPIVYEASDDFGLRNVSLVFQVNNNDEQRKIINYGGSGQIFDYRWRLAGIVLKPGDNISWRLIAKDNNNITGPGTALSPARYIRITSFEEEHALISLSQKEFSSNLLRLLAEETKVAGVLEKPDADISKTSFMQAGVLARTSALKSELSNIIRRMEADPLSDLATITEYKGMEKGLEELSSGAMSEALRNMEKLDIEGAKQALEETINILERMALLSQDAVKGANMRYAADSAERVAQYANDVADMLRQASSAKGLSKEKMSEILQILSQANSLIRDAVQRLLNMPGDLPQEFINKESIKELNLGQVNDVVSAIAEAIKAGNMDEALRLALNFLKQAQDMAQTIKDSATEVSSLAAYNPKTAADDIRNLNDNLGEIIKEEENLLARTVPFEENFRKRVVKHQMELLVHLADKQKKLLLQAEKTSPSPPPSPQKGEGIKSVSPLPRGQGGGEGDPLTPSPLRGEGGGEGEVLKMMKEVWHEFENGKVVSSQMWLETIIKTSTGVIATSEIAILKNLKEEPAGIFRKQEMADMQALGQTQEDLIAKTGSLHNELKKLAARALTLSPGSVTDIRKGLKEMGMAKTALKSANSTLSVRHEQLAIEALKHGQDALSQASQSLEKAAQAYPGENGKGSYGQPTGGRRTGIIRTVTPSGALSSQPYHIPTADEYQPPKEFREELLQALKEKYPEDYKELIRKYYKKLTD